MMRERERSGLAAVLAMTLAVQALTAIAMSVPSVIAPVAAVDLGHAPALIGVLVGVQYVLAGIMGPVCGTLIQRFGPARMIQAAVLAVAAGLVVAGSALAALALVFAALAGAAHGLVNPATSQILARAAPPGRRALIFSIKQTGVPVGAAITGALVPLLLLAITWQQTVIAMGAASLALLFAVAPFRAMDERQREPGYPIVVSRLLAPIAEVWRDRRMLDLAFASTAYSSVQTAFLTYLISYLNLELGFSLIVAGLVFSVATTAGIVGRIVWGAVADRLRNPRGVLAFLGFGMSICAVLATQFQGSWPLAAIMAACAAYGGTAVAWNGIFLAEVARLAPEGRVAVMTGGTQVFTFAGAMCGPPVFGLVTAWSGTYATGYIVFGVVPLLMGLRLAFARPAPKQAAVR